jgi:hypothetical protein
MKIRICCLVIALVPIFYYGFAFMAPAGRAATVSTGFRQLGKSAVARIESVQDAVSESDEVFQPRLSLAEAAVANADRAAVTAADRSRYTQLVRYLLTVKMEHSQALASGDAASVDHEPTNAAREAAERAFN